MISDTYFFNIRVLYKYAKGQDTKNVVIIWLYSSPIFLFAFYTFIDSSIY